MVSKKVMNFFIFIFIVFALDFSVGRTLRYFYFKQESGLQYRTTYALEQTEADILIFGASRANHHYVPEVFENELHLSYYNTGRDGNSIFYQTAVLKSVLKRYTPKIIILDFYGSFEKSPQDYERLSSLLPYYKTHEEIRSTVELKRPYEKLKLISQIYPFNSMLLTIAVGNAEFNKDRKSDNKGYISLYREWGNPIDSVINDVVLEQDSNKINSFKEFISLGKESGAQVFVIYSPIYRKYNRIPEIDSGKVVCDLEQISFLDFSTDTIFLNHSDLFQDIVHLNENGATIFSKLVLERMKLNHHAIP